MIDLRELNETIDDIKRKGGTVNDAVTLAMLYIAKDHMQREDSARTADETAQNYALAADSIPDKEMDERVKVRGSSEFLTACDGARIENVLSVLDEHLEAIRVLYPKEYDAVVEKIRKTQYR